MLEPAEATPCAMHMTPALMATCKTAAPHEHAEVNTGEHHMLTSHSNKCVLCTYHRQGRTSTDHWGTLCGSRRHQPAAPGHPAATAPTAPGSSASTQPTRRQWQEPATPTNPANGVESHAKKNQTGINATHLGQDRQRLLALGLDEKEHEAAPSICPHAHGAHMFGALDVPVKWHPHDEQVGHTTHSTGWHPPAK